MLSDKAWNALLKTVEEPPPHAKFVFATTEVRKVPITVLSRCQRFDLRRVPADTLAQHLAAICGRERVEAEPDALALVARAAEGSVRDALSLLDQAIALSEGPVATGTVQAMLGLGDRLKVLELFGLLLRGAAAEVLDRFGELYGLGADPLALVQDLLEVCHAVSRLKVRPEAAGALGLAGELARVAQTTAEATSLAVLARAWQMLLRGVDEVRIAPDGAAAAEMLLLRLACVSELPPPSELARLARGEPVSAPARAVGGGMRPVAAALPPVPQPQPVAAAPVQPQPVAQATAQPRSYAELVEMIARSGERLIAAFLYEKTHLLRFEPGRIELRLDGNVPPDLPSRLGEVAGRLTGRRWIVAVGSGAGDPPLAEQADAARRRRIAELGHDPDFRSLLEAFPGAEIVDVREAAPVSQDAASDQKGMTGR
jgi:DNA polymerase-3 subunit gamma/tau